MWMKQDAMGSVEGVARVVSVDITFLFVRCSLVVNEKGVSLIKTRAVEHCPTRSRGRTSSPEKLPAQKAPLELHFAVC